MAVRVHALFLVVVDGAVNFLKFCQLFIDGGEGEE